MFSRARDRDALNGVSAGLSIAVRRDRIALVAIWGTKVIDMALCSGAEVTRLGINVLFASNSTASVLRGEVEADSMGVLVLGTERG